MSGYVRKCICAFPIWPVGTFCGTTFQCRRCTGWRRVDAS